MNGNFKPLQLTGEYVRLKDELVNDATPSRSLWIPQEDAFTYASRVHPLLTSNGLFDHASLSAVIRLTQTPEFMGLLADAGVRYVIVPADLEKRFFLDDYRFNSAERSVLVGALKQTTLLYDPKYSDLAVFKNNQFTMNEEVPVTMNRQQQWATIGFFVSIVSMVTMFSIVLIWKPRT